MLCLFNSLKGFNNLIVDTAEEVMVYLLTPLCTCVKVYISTMLTMLILLHKQIVGIVQDLKECLESMEAKRWWPLALHYLDT